MSYNFTTKTHGKWILCGEHTVIRGEKALVFPVKNKTLTLQFDDKGHKLSGEFHGDCGDDIHLLFWSVIENGLETLGLSINNLSGHFRLDNQVPIGAGMGASAALCVAVTRWFTWRGLIDEKENYPFAKQLENLFHNKSSGLDIAGTASNNGISFQQGQIEKLAPSFKPHWYLSFSGHIGITSHCVKKVQALIDRQPELAKKIDDKMKESVLKAQFALAQDEINGLPLLAEAMNDAAICFKQWGLAGGHVEQHIAQLKEAGAMAAKPTGSGDGGYVLSLWQGSPPDAIKKDMIAV